MSDVDALSARIRAKRVRAGLDEHVQSPTIHALCGSLIADVNERRETSPQGDAAA